MMREYWTWLSHHCLNINFTSMTIDSVVNFTVRCGVWGACEEGIDVVLGYCRDERSRHHENICSDLNIFLFGKSDENLDRNSLYNIRQTMMVWSYESMAAGRPGCVVLLQGMCIYYVRGQRGRGIFYSISCVLRWIFYCYLTYTEGIEYFAYMNGPHLL